MLQLHGEIKHRTEQFLVQNAALLVQTAQRSQLISASTSSTVSPPRTKTAPASHPTTRLIRRPPLLVTVVHVECSSRGAKTPFSHTAPTGHGLHCLWGHMLDVASHPSVGSSEKVPRAHARHC
eukprot:2590437-Rhodomonas_salina.2